MTVKTDLGPRDHARRTSFEPTTEIQETDVQLAIEAAVDLLLSLTAGLPTTSVDNTIPRFSGTAGAFEDTAVTIDDNNFIGTLPGIGIGGATADVTNRISANTPAVLFNRETDDIQVKLNKEAAADTASFVFQTGFSGRAEIGLVGDDDFQFKVSPDGSTFFIGLIIDKDDGAVSAPVSLAVPDEAYDATGWNGDLTVPTKNAVRDYLETLTGTTLPATYQPLDADLTAIAALATAAYGRSLLTLADATALAAEVDSFFLTPAEGDALFLTPAEGDALFLTPAEGDAAYQPLDAQLTDLAGLAVTDGNIIVGNGTNWVAESGATARTSLGLGTGDSPEFAAINVGAATDTTLTRSGAGVIAVEGAVVRTAGKESIWVPGGAMVPQSGVPTTAGSYSSGASGNTFSVQEFPNTGLTIACFSVAMPKSWDEGGLTFRPYWTAASGSGDVEWDLEAKAISNDDPLDHGAGVTVTSTDTLTAVGDLCIGPESASLEAAGRAEGDLLFFNVLRDSTDAQDTLGATAILLGVMLFYTTNATNDA